MDSGCFSGVLRFRPGGACCTSNTARTAARGTALGIPFSPLNQTKNILIRLNI